MKVLRAGDGVRLVCDVWPTPGPSTLELHRGPDTRSRLTLPVVPAITVDDDPPVTRRWDERIPRALL